VTPEEALQAALGAEHAAVHVYGVLGGRLPTGDNPTVAERFRTAYDAHRGRRDQLRALLADLGATPVPPAAAYDLGGGLGADGRDPAALVRVAARTEERCASVHAQLVAHASEGTREWAVAALVDCAVRRLGFGGSPQPYPGLDELS
jgi:hypothetical protein